MKISVIQQGLGQRDIATIAPGATIAEAARTLSQRKIGALVVTADGKQIDGIISERDVVRTIGQDGAGAMDQPVEAVMTADVQTCTGDDTAIGLLGRMTRGRFRHLPVTDDAGNLSGILSIGDIVKARLDEMEAENRAMTEMLSH